MIWEKSRIIKKKHTHKKTRLPGAQAWQTMLVEGYVAVKIFCTLKNHFILQMVHYVPIKAILYSPADILH